MANEPDVIHQQMRETHAALERKLETLERQVTGTIHEVSATVENVKDAVHETVGTVRDSMSTGAQAVREAFDLERQTRRHPWLMLGGAVAIGYLGGCLVGARRPEQTADLDWSRPRPNGGPPASAAAASAPPARALTTGAPRQSGWLADVMDRFAPEIEKLEGLAIGAIFSVVKDLVRRNAPEQLRPQLNEIIDDIAVKMGGRPIEGSLLEDTDAEPTV
jgi:ElaB/YqjD/DUF883 family membrane-anchored ribosome-binding protein